MNSNNNNQNAFNNIDIALHAYQQQLMHQPWFTAPTVSNVTTSLPNARTFPTNNIIINNFNGNYLHNIYHQHTIYQQQMNAKNAPTAGNDGSDEHKSKDMEEKPKIKTTGKKCDEEINGLNGLSLEPINLEQQESTDSFIDSPMDMMTPNTLKSLLSASTYIPDQEREKNIEQKQLIKQEIKQKQERSSKSQLSAACNEFIPGVTVIKRQLSVINEDDEEDLFNDDNFDYFEQAQES
mmetsp:Transcript_65798/g.59077  ORF Transcript_65798/g.59077 Transcript_65798/m.59077 type:complete len:237 (-) Transcript_65798:87-797(-)